MVIRHSTKLYNFILGNHFKIVVLTSFHKNFLINCGVKKENIFIIPNPISFKNHNEKISIKEVIYAGRVSREKGLIELIDIFERLELSEYVLRIIGDGPLLRELKNKDFKKTVIEGPLDNETTKNIISKSELVITCTKLFEGQPTLLCEASSMGVPSIFPKTGGISEFFPTNYEFTFEQYNYEQLENKIITFLNTNQKKDIGKKNQDYLKEYLSEEFFVSKFDNLLDSLNS
jgi:glycosyltransferase involved in cell wall biosynthesis